MAEKAQAEPTMEEILASIRKIISDEGEGTRPAARPGARKPEPSVSVNVQDDEDFEDLSLDDVIEQAGGSAEALGRAGDDMIDPVGEAEDGDSLLSDVDETMFDELSLEEAATPSETPSGPADDFEDLDLESMGLGDEEPVLAAQAPEETGGDQEESADDDWDEEWDRDIPATDRTVEAAPPRHEETTMLRGKTESQPAPAGEGLTDERIAGAAASALGKLMVKQSGDNGNPNTLDGLMKELLRPMIKEWLDANLPAIVERKVEEEVQRIARMAR